MVPHLRNLISVIGDEETVTGFLLAGIGHVTHNSKNFLIVDSSLRVVISLLSPVYRLPLSKCIL